MFRDSVFSSHTRYFLSPTRWNVTRQERQKSHWTTAQRLWLTGCLAHSSRSFLFRFSFLHDTRLLEVEYQNEHFFCRRPSISIRWLEEEQVRNFIVCENSKERERLGKMERMEEAEIHTLFSSITLVHCCGYKTFWPQHLKRVGENIKAADAAVVSIFGNKTTGIGQDLAIEIRQGKWRKNDRKGKYFLSFHTRLAREVISHTNIVFHLSQLDFLPNLTTQETPCSMENPCAFRDNQSGNLNPNVVAFLWIHDKWFQSNNCLKCWVL